jgi:hypothetical protein
MVLGLPIYDYFRIPDDDTGVSSVIEYSHDHFQWQFEKAGFTKCRIEHVQKYHSPTNHMFHPFGWLDYLLHIIPR